MAYVRQKGNQLAIVHGEREAATGKVRQRVLFTIYSRAEAHEALGKPGDGGGRFERLIETEYPGIRFPWKRIRKAVQDGMGVLPPVYQYRPERLRDRFRSDLCAFSRQLLLTDPQMLRSSAEVLQEHRYELEFLSDLVKWRLDPRAQTTENEWNADNAFYWRFALRGRRVPGEAEEMAEDLFEKRDYERAEAAFRLLIDCFDDYADGHNYLGLMALERRQFDAAIAHFEKTVEVGRRLFPARISKKRYWREMKTRPYVRGLRNLSHTMNAAGRYADALALCDRLEEECGDDASWQRACVSLNTRRWREAADRAKRLTGLHPEAGFLAAFGSFELGLPGEALGSFLHAALNGPRAARMLAGQRLPAPRGGHECRDHNAGVALLRGLHEFLRRRSRGSKRFFREILRDPRVSALLAEVEQVVRRREERHATGDRTAFDRMTAMHSREFAQREAAKLRDLAEAPAVLQ